MSKKNGDITGEDYIEGCLPPSVLEALEQHEIPLAPLAEYLRAYLSCIVRMYLEAPDAMRDTLVHGATVVSTMGVKTEENPFLHFSILWEPGEDARLSMMGVHG